MDTSIGAYLTMGGTWTNSSDRNEKENLSPVDSREVLEKLSDDDLRVVFQNLNSDDIEKLLAGDFTPVVKKVLVKRPQLLKVLSVLVER